MFAAGSRKKRARHVDQFSEFGGHFMYGDDGCIGHTGRA